MKKTIFILSLIILTYGSCKEIDKLTHFNMEYSTDITVNSVLYIDIPFDIWTPDLPTNSETTFENNDTRSNLIEEIIITKMNMEITSPNNQTFDFLKSIEIYINAEGEEEKKIAWLTDIPKTGLKFLELNTIDDDLKNYIKKDEYKLRTSVTTRELVTQTTNIKVNSNFFVDAKILGL